MFLRVPSCKRRSRGGSRRGYVLLTTGIAVFAVMGMTGLAIDLGRMYVAKNESQAFVDASAIEAALQLNGTLAGFERARQAVANSANRWNFGSEAFTNPLVEFSLAAGGPWEAAPATAVNYRFARVCVTAPVPMSFIQTLSTGMRRPVTSKAVAAQVEITSLREGLFPFSPFAHPPEVRQPGADPVSGLVPGQLYTLRWGANPKIGNPNTSCVGDRYQEVFDIARAGGGDERGYIDENSSAIIRQAIVADYQTVIHEVGDTVTMTGGAKQTQRDALVERVRQDSDQTSTTFAEYFNNGNPRGNGRRVVAAPINLGAPGGYQIVQFGAFFLLDESKYLEAMGGNKPFCAEYVGSYVQGGNGTGAGGPGYYVVRLVR